jgi:hypothetical protein
MQYADGSPLALGDIVTVPIPNGTARARVVMLGENYDHLDIDAGFVAWVKNDHILEPGSVVVEWIDGNPLAHSDPQYAPVGNYMFSPVDQYLLRAA